MSDDQLQQDFESGKLDHDTSREVSAYRHVFRTLEKDRGYQLRDDFSARVVLKLQQKNASLFKEYFWLVTGILLLFISMIVAVAFVGFQFSFGFLATMSPYKGLFIFGVAFILVLHVVEKRFLKIKA